ncbi:hypothetical protein PoB_001046200 [Plakobranchus ocellatus]|uniref:Uncharacterized protein n=1 Tax=Plakobranchus ocellatus TaxID=259542 RepID=A0AAV3YM06_9GAST|nr:hypothetical protein PoB_001046200 [Plakobranchus ocellatus]
MAPPTESYSRCARKLSLKAAEAPLTKGAPANNAATNAPLSPNNNADAPSSVAPTTNEDVMRGRRRKRNPSSWKRNVIASKRLRGKSILSTEEKSIALLENSTRLQVVTPSPRKLRTGPILKNTPTVSSQDAQDISDEMFSSDSD